MVFLTALNLVRSRGPAEIWRKRRIFQLTAHNRGRTRNCYGLAIRLAHRALVYATKGRRLRREDRCALWERRIEAGALENNLQGGCRILRTGLERAQVALDRRALSDLATWEGRTFSALSALAKYRMGWSEEPLGELYFRNRIS